MSCRTETKQIGDHEYSVTQWPAEKSLLMKFKLVEILGPGFNELMALTATKDAKALVSGISAIVSGSSPEKIVSLIKDCIVENVACDGKRITERAFRELFSGDNLMEVYKVFFFVLKTNYAGFPKGQNILE